ncbi:uncharacterized protein PHALS_13320 [Plasmopara halstedii]|uniref:Uncharacterized protein n=1 Tax=Plasmopara halstedii TaxID=4781 RepID=A0A0P1API3_PLAHL|nr:uncharacterized protein PHALS_13320 [Plasmopara halstedii]CEG43102.1 hypothetical protein PHALS_13320 [Plasmopara halstedii]|eukprot:XP_024579471.1 hypothetical protein PHALS_13320 [Plasmopara halstedii]
MQYIQLCMSKNFVKRRPLSNLTGFGYHAVCICLSTIFLQSLTASFPLSFLSRLSLADYFSWSYESDVDLHLHNLSVQRVRYWDVQKSLEGGNREDFACKPLLDSLITTTTGPSSAEISAVVVTWEDHPLAAQMRSQHTRLKSDILESKSTDTIDNSAVYYYEVQIWVPGWGLDALWNPANNLVVTKDPFLVLQNIPTEYEVKYRVRIKLRQTEKSLSELLPSIDFLSVETDGPWSDVVTLSPTRKDEVKEIVAHLAGNKLLLVLLTVCIGSGCIVIIQLYFRQSHRQQQVSKMDSSPRIQFRKNQKITETDVDIDLGKSIPELIRDLCDLRQELADSEDEVRKLMLLSGYGIESLSLPELKQLECRLKHTLERISFLKLIKQRRR